MFLFGNKISSFKHNFSKYFMLNYDSTKQCTRIIDKISKSCVVNVKLPFIISETHDDLLKSLYIQIFKYDCAFHLRYDDEEFELFNHVYTSLDTYYKNVINPRDTIYNKIDDLSFDVAIEHANNMFFKREPSLHFLNTLDRIDLQNKCATSLNIYSIQENKFLIR